MPRLPLRVLKTEDEMNRVIAHFVGRDFRFEIESAEAALATANRVQLWIEVVNALSRSVDQAQVRVTRALDPSLSGLRKIASQARRDIEQIANHVLERAAHFVDPA